MKEIMLWTFEGAKIRVLLAVYVLIAVGSGFLLLYANELLMALLNENFMTQNFDGFLMQFLVIVGMFAAVFASSIFAGYIHGEFEIGSQARLIKRCMDRLMGAKFSFFVARPAAEIYQGLWTAVQVVPSFYVNLLSMFGKAVSFVFFGIIVFSVDTFAGFFALLALPVYFLFTLGVGNKISALQNEYVKQVGALAVVATEPIENVNNIKAKGVRGFFEARYMEVHKKLKRVIVGVIVWTAYINGVTAFVRMVSPLLIIFAAIQLSPNFTATAGNITILFINIPLFLTGMADIHKAYIHFKMTKPFLTKLTEFSEAEQEVDTGEDIGEFKSLKVSGVKVTFEGGKEIHVPDFEATAGEKIMLSGDSGVGKSTIFNILQGLLTDYEGDVLVNGINLRDAKISSVRKAFGITFQNTNVMTASIDENAKLGAKLEAEEFEKIAEIVRINAMRKNKKDDEINNKTLSGGERSRIGLAQMITFNPQVMLIDEAFSSVDEELESSILTDLTKSYASKTIICISHRASSRVYFDRVIEF